MESYNMKQLWGSRFSKKIDSKVNDFNSSLPFDYKMYKQDIQGSLAHSEMLGAQGILSEDEVKVVKCNPEYDVRFKIVEWYEQIKHLWTKE